MRLLPLLLGCLLISTPLLAQLPSYVPTNGLVAWYPFNGNANDESGNGHDGIITGATFSEDRNGNADASIEFNGYPVPGTNRTQVGLDNHVYVPDFDDPFSNGLSISLWALEFPTSESAFLQRRNNNNIDFNLELNTSNQIAAHLGFTSFSSQESMPSEQWTHLTLTYDEESIKLYKDGALIEEQAASQSVNNFANELFIGKYIYYGGLTHHFFFNGRQDDLGIWNRTLTAQEVEAMFLSEPVNRIGGTLRTDGTDEYASFQLPSGWGESSFSVHFSATIEDFGTTSEVDGEHYLFGHALTGQNGDVGFKAQTIPDAQQMRWTFSDDDGDGSLNIIANPVLEANTWYDFTLVFDRTTSQANVYINGEEAGSAAIPSNLGNLESGLPVGLGAFVYPPSSDFRHFHQGQFGDAYFFPAALTASQVEDLALTCSAPLVAGSAHWGVQEDEYVNLATLEPVTRVGGVVSQSAAPCQTSCTNPNIAEPTLVILMTSC